MIEKERFDKLVSKGATIYGINRFGLVERIDTKASWVYKVQEEGLLQINRIVYGSGEGDYQDLVEDRFHLSCLYEKKRDALWHSKFGSLWKTLCLSFPKWETFLKNPDFCFYKINGDKCTKYVCLGEKEYRGRSFSTLKLLKQEFGESVYTIVKETDFSFSGYDKLCGLMKKIFLEGQIRRRKKMKYIIEGEQFREAEAFEID